MIRESEDLPDNAYGNRARHDGDQFDLKDKKGTSLDRKFCGLGIFYFKILDSAAEEKGLTGFFFMMIQAVVTKGRLAARQFRAFMPPLSPD